MGPFDSGWDEFKVGWAFLASDIHLPISLLSSRACAAGRLQLPTLASRPHHPPAIPSSHLTLVVPRAMEEPPRRKRDMLEDCIEEGGGALCLGLRLLLSQEGRAPSAVRGFVFGSASSVYWVSGDVSNYNLQWIAPG